MTPSSGGPDAYAGDVLVTRPADGDVFHLHIPLSAVRFVSSASHLTIIVPPALLLALYGQAGVELADYEQEREGRWTNTE